MRQREIGRRAFLASAGASFLASLAPARAERLIKAKAVFISGYMDSTKNFGFALLDENGGLVHFELLPGRAHGFAASPSNTHIVGFARRPGMFAVAIDPLHRHKPRLFHAPEGRHFYGHGAFSADGKLLYATENDFETGDGKIGIYDASDEFQRVGEFESYGVGPHEMVLMSGGRLLAVANGGIRTHPASGRQKLNLPEMQSNFALIDTSSGHLVATFVLPPAFRRMSLRHMTMGRDETLWIGGQFQGDLLKAPSPIFRLSPGGELINLALFKPARAALSGYVGSVAVSQDGNKVGFTSPKGGSIVELDTRFNAQAIIREFPRACGLAGAAKGLAASSELGKFGNQSHNLHWDNHISRLLESAERG